MNWQSLTKEQKQKVAMISMVSVLALFVLWQFALMPWLRRSSAARDELVGLQTQLELANQAIRAESVTSTKMKEADVALAKVSAEKLPSAENPLSWVTREIYTQARTVGVDIESISEMGAGGGGAWDVKEMMVYAFKPYAVRIDTACGYDQLYRFVKTLEENNPYIGVLDITIAAKDGSPDVHEVNLILEWPTWKDPAKAPHARKETHEPA